MKNTRKALLALLVLMTILTSLVAFAIPASAANIPAGTKLYLVPSANWNQNNARFAAYFFGTGEAWASMTKVSGETNLYEVTVPQGSWTNVIFCRMKPDQTDNNWNNKWNQTSDLVYNGTSNCYTVTENTWDKGGGTWSTYGSTCMHTNLGAEATCTTPQTCLDCGDPVVSALGHTYTDAHLCTRCNNQGTFTVAGTGKHLGTEWDTGNTANDMTYADGVYTKVYEKVAAGTYKFKVVRDHDWGTAYPSQDKSFTVAENGSTVTITLTGTTVDVEIEVPDVEPDHVHAWSDATCDQPQICSGCGEHQGEPKGHSFNADGKCTVCEFNPVYVVAGDVMQVNDVYQTGTNFLGSIWDGTDGNNKLAYNTETSLFEKSYSGVVIGEYHVKIVCNGTNWIGDSTGENYYIAVSADNSIVTITFDPKTNTIAHTSVVSDTPVDPDPTPDTDKVYIAAGDVMMDANGEYIPGGVNFFGTSWNASDETNLLVYDEEAGAYVKVYENVFAGEYHFKITENKTWTVSYGENGGADNCYINVAEDGSTVTIIFKDGIPSATVTAPQAPVDPDPEQPVNPDPEQPVNPDPEQPENPDPEQPEAPEEPEELSFVEKIIKAITDFFANISAWFKNLLAGFKK